MLKLPEENFGFGKYPKNEEIIYAGAIEGRGKLLTRKIKIPGTAFKYVVSLWKNFEDAEDLTKEGALGFSNEEEMKLYGDHEFGELPYLRCRELESYFPDWA